MAAETELTIVVRVKDAASKILDGIKKTVSGALLAPFKQLGKDAEQFIKKLISVKTYIFAITTAFAGTIAAVRALAKDAHEFEAVFSPEQQQGIDRTATALNRMVASVKSVLGAIGAEPLFADLFDGISNFLRDHREDLISMLRTVVQALRDAAALVRQIFSGGTSIGALIGFSGTNMFGLPEFKGDASAARTNALANDAAQQLAIQSQQLQSQTREVAATVHAALTRAFIEEVNQSSGGEGESILARIMGFDKLERLTDISAGLAKIKDGFTDTAAAADQVAKAMAEGFRTGGDQGALTAGMRAAADVLEDFNDAAKASPPIVRDIGKAAKEATPEVAGLVAEVKSFLLTLDDVAQSVSTRGTDAFFAFIKGTEKAGRAFTSMVSSILEDISRLLLQRAILSAVFSIAGAFGGAAGGSPTGGPGGVPEPGGNLSAGISPNNPTQFAAGGHVRRGAIVRVGEQGPEDAYMPAGSFIRPSYQSGGEGNVIIHVNGARDPVATAREIEMMLSRRGKLRQKVRAA